MDDQDYLDAKEALDLAHLARQRPPLLYNLTSASELNTFQVGADVSESEVSAVTDPVYEQFLADIWVGIVLTLMVTCCVCFMCTCLIYHKIREWKIRSIQNRHHEAGLESGLSELPSYTVASGLPTYDEALEQLKKFQPHHPEISSSDKKQHFLISKHQSIVEQTSQVGRGVKSNARSLSLSRGSGCQNLTNDSNSLSVLGCLNISNSSRKLSGIT